jgi:serine/threonine-protein kinase
VVFTVGDSRNPSYYDDSRIDAVNMETGARTTVYEGAMFARFAANDRLLLQRGATLFAVDVDPATLAVTSTPRTLIDDVGMEASSGAGYFAASLTDAMAYVPSKAIPDEKSLVFVGEDGSEETLPLDPKAFWQPRLSPDGRQLAFAVGSLGGGGGIDSDLWLYDTKARHTSRLTFQPGRQIPLWSPDGKRIIYTSANSETTKLYVKPSDGSGAEETIEGISNEVGFADAFTPDGQSVIVTTVNSIKMLQAPVTGGGSSMLFDDPGAQWGASFSPDGKYLAYVSTETGVDEIFVRPWPIQGGKWQVSVEGGQFPVWSRDGRRLFYVSDGVVYGCDVSADGGAFRASAPREVVRGPYELRTAPVRNFDIGPDGRFVFVRLRTDVVASRQLEVLLGWSAELEKR